MPVLVALCVFVWIRLGDMECVKRGQRIILEDAIARGPARWASQNDPAVGGEMAPVPNGAAKLPARAVGMCGANCMLTVGRLLHYWKWILGVAYRRHVAAGLSGAVCGQCRICGLWFPRVDAALARHVSPVAAWGTKERCRATIGTVVAMSLLLMAAALAVVVLSWLLTLFLGGPPAEGSEVTYKALQARSVFLACLLVPWFAALGLLGVRVRSLGELVRDRLSWLRSCWPSSPSYGDADWRRHRGCERLCGSRRVCGRVAVSLAGSVGRFQKMGLGESTIDQRQLRWAGGEDEFHSRKSEAGSLPAVDGVGALCGRRRGVWAPDSAGGLGRLEQAVRGLRYVQLVVDPGSHIRWNLDRGRGTGTKLWRCLCPSPCPGIGSRCAASFVRAVRWGVVFALFAFSHSWWELHLPGTGPRICRSPRL